MVSLTKDCVHHWLVETIPQKGKENLSGICKRCGGTREFPTQNEEILARSRYEILREEKDQANQPIW